MKKITLIQILFFINLYSQIDIIKPNNYIYIFVIKFEVQIILNFSLRKLKVFYFIFWVKLNWLELLIFL